MLQYDGTEASTSTEAAEVRVQMRSIKQGRFAADSN
jgi:hypothetical protein